MLGKLIKHDMKAAARGVSSIYLAALIAVAAMGICLFANVGVGKFVSSLLLIGVSIAAIIVTIVATLGEFRKSVFGDRGYLTNTLPVKGPALLFSKLLTSMVWITISYLVVFLCFFLVYYYWTGEDPDSMLVMFMDYLPELGVPSIDVLITAFIVIAVKLIFLIVVFVTVVFFALTLSNVRPFSNLGAFGAVLYFFAVFGLVVFLSSRSERLLTTALLIDANNAISLTASAAAVEEMRAAGGAAITLTQVYVEIIAAAVLFVVTAELLDKKVNIK